MRSFDERHGDPAHVLGHPCRTMLVGQHVDHVATPCPRVDRLGHRRTPPRRQPAHRCERRGHLQPIVGDQIIDADHAEQTRDDRDRCARPPTLLDRQRGQVEVVPHDPGVSLGRTQDRCSQQRRVRRLGSDQVSATDAEQLLVASPHRGEGVSDLFTSPRKAREGRYLALRRIPSAASAVCLPFGRGEQERQ